MTNETIVAVYDTAEHAALAVSDLEAAGIPSSAISVHAKEKLDTSTTGAAVPVREQGFWASLFGGEPDHDASVYDRSVESGASVVTVKVAGEHVEQVTRILEQHGAVDLDDRAASYGYATPAMATTTTTTAASTTASPGMPSGRATALPAGEEVLSLSEEQLSVGKRLINRGTTRIRRFVVETPVEEAVTLHAEHVSIERRPVADSTKVTEAAFTDRVIEVTESEEEAVVAKTARVREEVVVNKAATDRVETVRDTVRREDVEITQDGHGATTSGTSDPIVPPRV
jgi:uncharacterized protein (TIGR02271 family)